MYAILKTGGKQYKVGGGGGAVDGGRGGGRGAPAPFGWGCWGGGGRGFHPRGRSVRFRRGCNRHG